MNVNLWVPQLFYDVIGRIIPGTLILLWGLTPFILGCDEFNALIDRIIFAVLGDNFIVVFLSSLMVSYIIGVIFGALWRLIDSHLFHNRIEFCWFRRAYDDIYSKLKQKDLFPNDAYSADFVAYIYDAIQLKFPKAGARIAKLRAEQHQGGVLTFGFIFAACLHGLSVWPLGLLPTRMLSFSVIAIILALGSYGFLAYMCMRGGSAVACIWSLYVQGKEEN